MRSKILYSCILFLIAFSSAGWAETIYFKDGHSVKGQFISKDDIYTVIKEGKFPRKYYNYLIDRIEQDKLSAEEKVISSNELSNVFDKKELVRLFLEANGTKASIENNFKAIIEKAQPDKKEKLQQILEIDKIIGMLIPIYEKHFDEDELKQLIKFYQSPAGSKFLSISPVLMQETMSESIKYFQEKEKELEP